MAKVAVYNKEGKKVKDQDVPDTWFAVEANTDVIHQVVVAQQNNKRKTLAHTKDRSEVRGGGKKPWRQKGTGRARHGSIRSPLWKGGGVTFGPRKNKNYTSQINRKMAGKALAMILTAKAVNDQFFCVADFGITDEQTKNLDCILKKLPVKSRQTMLLLRTDEMCLNQASDNLDTTKTSKADSVNAEAAIMCPSIVVSEKGLKEFIEKHKV